MSSLPTITAPSRPPADADARSAPAWARDWVDDELVEGSRCTDDFGIAVRDGSAFRLVSVRVLEADHLSPDAFEERTTDVYRAIAAALQAGHAPHPVRFWNHLPHIHAPSGGGIDRYMNFNAGRFRAFSEWLGGSSAFDRAVPTASAVGYDGPDLFVHALGSRAPGTAVANPRQVAPHRYSKRFGPLPPCFARATVLPASGTSASPLVLVGGTASIRGEDSIHLCDLAQQTQETFDNLACLIRAAGGETSPDALDPRERAAWLACFRNLRIYYAREAHRAEVAEAVASHFPPSCRTEYLRADLCRPELLVEIEGIATSRVPAARE